MTGKIPVAPAPCRGSPPKRPNPSGLRRGDMAVAGRPRRRERQGRNAECQKVGGVQALTSTQGSVPVLRNRWGRRLSKI